MRNLEHNKSSLLESRPSQASKLTRPLAPQLVCTLTFGEDELHGAGLGGEHLLAHAHDRLVAAWPGALRAALLQLSAFRECRLPRVPPGQEFSLQVVLCGPVACIDDVCGKGRTVSECYCCRSVMRQFAYPGSLALVLDSDLSLGSPNFVLLRSVYWQGDLM